MNYTPMYDNVLILPDEKRTETDSGIILTDSTIVEPDRGTVVAVGFGEVLADGKIRDLCVQLGARVVFGKYAGARVDVDGVEHIIMLERDILLVEGNAPGK